MSRTWHRPGLTAAILLLIAAVHGLAYVVLIPPWSVPDEPRHFAYVRSLWLRSRGQDDSPQVVEKQILDSMIRHRWFAVNHIYAPDKPPEVFDDIPFLRLSDPAEGRQPATYYELSALTLTLSGQTDVDSQLYTVRLLSTLLGVTVVGLALRTARTIFSDDQTAMIAVGGVTILLPERAFIAAGVNNDTLAIVAVSVVFLSLATLAVRGSSLVWFLILLTGCGLVVTSKATALGILPAVVVVAGAVARSRSIARKWSARNTIYVALPVLFLAALLGSLAVETCDAPGWHKFDGMPCSRVDAIGPAGPFALRVNDDSELINQTLYQVFPSDITRRLQGQTVTIGAWVRTPSPQQVGYMQLYDGKTWHTKEFTASQQWEFFAQPVVVDRDASELDVNLNATEGSPEATGEVIYAGVVVVRGDFADDSPPIYLSGGRSVQWHGQVLENFVENGNALRPGITLKPFVEDRVATIGAMLPSQAMAQLLDIRTYEEPALSAYASYTSILMDSFWAVFGWMNVRLPSTWYVVLKVVTLVSLAGAIWSLIGFRPGALGRATGSIRCITALSLLAVLSGFAMAFLREVPPLGQSQGRYALPVVVPFAIVLYVGLQSLGPRAVRPWLAPVLLLFLVVLNAEILIVAANQ